MQILEIKNLVKIYNDSEVKVKAVDHVNLSFEEGEFAAIVGPSGSGKTTLLNMIGGLDSITEGDILVEGTSIGSLSSSKLINFRLKNIGFVFQAYNLIPVMTARENVEFIMQLQGRKSKERHERAMELLNAVGLG
jgi:putative ABC transport system ATP-binding protein